MPQVKKSEIVNDRNTFVLMIGSSCLSGRVAGCYTTTKEPAEAWSFSHRNAALCRARDVYVDSGVYACITTRHEARRQLGRLLEGAVDA